MPKSNDTNSPWVGWGLAGRAAAICLALLAPAAPAWAQLLNQLPGNLGQGGGGAAGMLGGMGGLPSVDQASPSNVAGVLQFCIKNNYLSGGGARSVGSSLLSKVGGGHGDSGFASGASGALQTGHGSTFDLAGGGGGGGGLKAQATHKVCDLVLQHAKSLL